MYSSNYMESPVKLVSRTAPLPVTASRTKETRDDISKSINLVHYSRANRPFLKTSNTSRIAKKVAAASENISLSFLDRLDTNCHLCIEYQQLPELPENYLEKTLAKLHNSALINDDISLQSGVSGDTSIGEYMQSYKDNRNKVRRQNKRSSVANNHSDDASSLGSELPNLQTLLDMRPLGDYNMSMYSDTSSASFSLIEKTCSELDVISKSLVTELNKLFEFHPLLTQVVEVAEDGSNDGEVDRYITDLDEEPNIDFKTPSKGNIRKVTEDLDALYQDLKRKQNQLFHQLYATSRQPTSQSKRNEADIGSVAEETSGSVDFDNFVHIDNSSSPFTPTRSLDHANTDVQCTEEHKDIQSAFNDNLVTYSLVSAISNDESCLELQIAQSEHKEERRPSELKVVTDTPPRSSSFISPPISAPRPSNKVEFTIDNDMLALIDQDHLKYGLVASPAKQSKSNSMIDQLLQESFIYHDKSQYSDSGIEVFSGVVGSTAFFKHLLEESDPVSPASATTGLLGELFMNSEFEHCNESLMPSLTVSLDNDDPHVATVSSQGHADLHEPGKGTNASVAMDNKHAKRTSVTQVTESKEADAGKADEEPMKLDQSQSSVQGFLHELQSQRRILKPIKSSKSDSVDAVIGSDVTNKQSLNAIQAIPRFGRSPSQFTSPEELIRKQEQERELKKRMTLLKELELLATSHGILREFNDMRLLSLQDIFKFNKVTLEQQLLSLNNDPNNLQDNLSQLSTQNEYKHKRPSNENLRNRRSNGKVSFEINPIEKRRQMSQTSLMGQFNQLGQLSQSSQLSQASNDPSKISNDDMSESLATFPELDCGWGRFPHAHVDVIKEDGNAVIAVTTDSTPSDNVSYSSSEDIRESTTAAQAVIEVIMIGSSDITRTRSASEQNLPNKLNKRMNSDVARSKSVGGGFSDSSRELLKESIIGTRDSGYEDVINTVISSDALSVDNTSIHQLSSSFSQLQDIFTASDGSDYDHPRTVDDTSTKLSQEVLQLSISVLSDDLFDDASRNSNTSRLSAEDQVNSHSTSDMAVDINLGCSQGAQNNLSVNGVVKPTQHDDSKSANNMTNESLSTAQVSAPLNEDANKPLLALPPQDNRFDLQLHITRVEGADSQRIDRDDVHSKPIAAVDDAKLADVAAVSLLGRGKFAAVYSGQLRLRDAKLMEQFLDQQNLENSSNFDQKTGLMNASVSPLGTARSSVTGFTDVMLKLTTPISPTPSTGSPVATGANNRKLRQQKELLAQQRLKEERESPFTIKHAKLLQKVKPVALKIAQFKDNEIGAVPPRVCIAEFLLEAKALTTLIHPNIISLEGISIKPLVLALELVNNSNLYTRLADTEWQTSILTSSIRLQIMLDIASGLQFVHSKNFIHRDIKTHNILLHQQSNGTLLAKIGDFGSCLFVSPFQTNPLPTSTDLLRQVKTPSATNPSMLGKDIKKTFSMKAIPSSHATSSASLRELKGSSGYMSPEMLARRGYSFATDVFSFAIVAWELFLTDVTSPQAARNPLVGIENDAALTLLQAGVRPPFQSSHEDAVRDLIAMCWTTDPKTRANMAAVAAALSHFPEF